MMSFKFSILIFTTVFFTVFSKVSAQEPLVINWQHIIGGERNELAYAGVETTDGGYMVVGSTNSKNSFDVKTSYGFDGVGGNDFWIAKINSLGALEWSKTFGGSGDDVATSIIKTANDEYAIIGTTLSTNGDANFNGVNGGLLLVRLKLNGDLVSKRLFVGGNRNNEASFYATSSFSKPVIKLLSNGQMIVGASYSIGKTPFTSYDFFAALLTPLGDTLWEKTYGGGLEDYLNDLIPTQDGGYLMLGTTLSISRDIEGAGNGFYDFLMIKVDASGKELWKKGIGGSGYDVLHAGVEISGKNEYLLVGESSSSNGTIGNSLGEKDGILLKIDQSGTVMNRIHLGGKDNDGFFNIQNGTDGYIYLLGTSESVIGTINPRGPKTDVWLCAIDASLQVKYHRLFGGADIDLTRGVVINKKGELMLTASSRSTDGDLKINRGQSDFWMVLLSPPPPVIFNRFDAFLTAKDEVQLEWSTIYEKNVQYFYVEKSIDNKTYNKLIEEFAFGNSNLTRYYRFTDKNPYTGKAFYRIRYADKDNNFFMGPSTSFSFVPLSMEPIREVLRAYPNPFSDNLNVKTSLRNPTFKLLNQEGRSFGLKVKSISIGEYTLEAEQKLNPGMFLLQVFNEESSETRKVFRIN